MTIFFEYLLKISLCYGAVYLFYFMLLRYITHYAVNRFFLLLFSVVAFFIPLLSVDFFITSETLNTSSFVNSIPSVHIDSAKSIFIHEADPGNIVYSLVTLLVAGMVICFLHFLVQLISFQKIRNTAQLINNTGGIRLYHLNMDIIPFSFGNAVYVNKLQHTEEELDEIIKHESVHVHQKHTVDILLIELICMLNWYNPFVWLIKHAIKQNLEFLADDAVVRNGTDKKSYQYLLLKVMGHSPLTIASNLNFSSLKKRIYMMNKTKTSKRHMLKLLFVLPVIALLMLAFRDTGTGRANANQSNTYTSEETFKLNELTYSIPDPKVATIVRKEQEKSLLQPGKPFTITLIKHERDRLKSLLEKSGYNNITNRSISFLIDSSSTNNSFSVQVNIDLQEKAVSISNISDRSNKKASIFLDTGNKFYSTVLPVSSFANSFEKNDADQQLYTTEMNTGHSVII